MKIVVAPEAAAQILVRKRWWRTNRPNAPERFDAEVARAFTAIAERPESFPVFSARGGRTVRRCLLAKTKCHLYFELVETTNEVWIIGARGAVQRPRQRLSKR